MEFESFVAVHSRAEIVAYLSEARLRLSDDDYKKVEGQMWLAYARKERPGRTLRLLMSLIDKAQHMKAVTYKDVWSVTSTEAHNENMVIIKAIGEVCKNKRWPPYAVLIKTERGNVGSGFFKDYSLGGSPRQLGALEEAMGNLCFESRAPDMPEVSDAVQAHFSIGN